MKKNMINQNESTGSFTVYETAEEMHRATTVQNVDDILAYAADMRSATQGQKYGEMRHMGLLPTAVVGQAIREGWITDQVKLRQWFKDNPAFKTFDKGF